MLKVITGKYMKRAVFAMGCFWGVEDFFSKIKGVTGTRVGYTGGTKKNPDYENLGDHTESIEITYDPGVISYQELLDHFWKEHDPTEPQIKQYQSAIFYLDENQKKLAERSLEKEQGKYTKKIMTEIRPASRFYQAEEYHQKYHEKLRKKKDPNIWIMSSTLKSRHTIARGQASFIRRFLVGIFRSCRSRKWNIGGSLIHR